MKSATIERLLGDHPEIDWEYGSVALSQINRAKSLANQARVSAPLSHDKVMQYKECLINGDEFPAIVVFLDKTGPDSFVTMDGNHRWAASEKAGRKQIDAYICIVPTPELRNALTYEFNNVMTGFSPTEEDRDHHAVNLLSQNWTVSQVAQFLRLPEKRVSEALQDYRGHERARKHGVLPSWSRIEQRTGRVMLHRRLTLDSVFAQAVQLASKFNFTVAQMKDLINDTITFSSEAEQLGFLKKHLSQSEKAHRKALEEKRAQKVAKLAAQGKGKKTHPGASPRTLFSAHIGYILKAKIKDALNGLDAEEREELLAKVKQAKQTLTEAELALAD